MASSVAGAVTNASVRTRPEWPRPCRIDLVMTTTSTLKSPMLAMLAVTTSVTLLAGCARVPGATQAASAPLQEGPTTSMGAINEVPGDMIDEIVADAAERAGVASEAVQILTAESVTWSDGSLGCPEPGMMYTQALVPGYRVVVEAGGDEMSFHASDRGEFRLCANPKPPLERNPNE